MSNDRFTGEYKTDQFATAIAGIIGGWLQIMRDDSDRLHMARVLERHARRLRYDSQIQSGEYTIRAKDNDRLPFAVIDSTGEVVRTESFESACEYISEELAETPDG